MGIESDQVVYEYLSRVGDVAQQRQLPSATRMRLVSELRNEIDRHRARTTVDSPAAVRRILDRLGNPYDIVDAAGDTSGASGGSGAGGVPQPSVPPSAAVPVQPEGGPRKAEGGPRKAERLKGLRRAVPRPRPAAPDPGAAPAPPHLASADELGSGGGTRPDWWRVDSGPYGGGLEGGFGSGFGGGGDSVPGFVGGVEIPELLRPPPRDMGDAAGAARRNGTAERAEAVAEAGEPIAGDPGGTRRRRRLPRLWPEVGWSNPLLLLAAALLVTGAVLDSRVPLGLGWLIVYLSRRLTPAQRKWAVLGLPGTVAAAGLVWLWGRTEGRWGDLIAEGHMNDAVAETGPWVLRTAAVATALYLLWRSRRPRS
ncbi:membrane protein [Streptomyces marokkonensis]|uniref:Membrane protein n=1 Tax=Streptomyces marokkonensis TaxID=324855 RepID=A0ABP7R7T6_9ACTN